MQSIHLRRLGASRFARAAEDAPARRRDKAATRKQIVSEKNRNFRATVSLLYFLNKSTPICRSKPAEHSRMAGLCPCGANVSQFSERMIPVLRYTPLSMTNSRRSDSRAPLRYARNDIFSFVILRRKPRRDSDVRIDRVVSANRRPARSHGEKTCFYHFLLPSVGAASNESLANSFASRQHKRNLKGGAKRIRMTFFAGARLDLAKTDAPQFYGTFVPFRLWRLGKVNFALACWLSLASKSLRFCACFSSGTRLLRTKMRSL